MTPKLIDHHCHLEMITPEADMQAVIRRAFEAGLEAMVTVASDPKSNHAALAIAHGHDNIYCTVGLHPHEARLLTDELKAELTALAKKDKVVAISREGTAIGSNFTAEGIPEELGLQHPQDILLKWNDPGVIEGEIKFKVTKVVNFFDIHRRLKPFQKWFARRYIGKPAYFRSFLTYDADIKVKGERVTGKGKAWCEHHKFL
ncbi:MAG: TatD family hydrolase [Dehalococcoidia bacterium]|nr:TatD family hydrolase [Dehalococcoidia bacterium]